MENGKRRVIAVLSNFTGRDGEPGTESETYTLKAMWLMMLSEFEASIKLKVESYIDRVKLNDISDIHVCILARHFFGNSEQELTINKMVSWYKKDPSEINYRNFTQDRVPKYKQEAVVKLFNSLGIFFNDSEQLVLSKLNSIASTRDSIAHGDTSIAITRRELEDNLSEIENIMTLLDSKLIL